MVSILKTVAASSLSTIILAGAASAASFTPTQEQSFSFASLGGDTTLSFDGFDSSLGELIGFNIELEFDATLNNTASVFPPGSGDQNVGTPTPLTATATITAAVLGALGLSVSDSLTTPEFDGIVPDNSMVNVVGTASTTDQMASQSYSSPANDLSSLIGGTNAVSVLLSSSGSQGGSVPNSVLTGNNGNADVTVRVFYEFEPAATESVPEPGMLLGLASVAGAGFISRRRKS
ncbi:choice-of-anchor E domain-containing protein [Cyanothece sp. BG0011]|uniref:choice-of-anchor E domain-containing protein n=1 Tax=Cyanothece sp. BG0011 TaxID=2082950 RepID=UPI000D1EF206|nr:PEP-CTERM sorting domain-containing protein [Cyanothece sp. BG0011]